MDKIIERRIKFLLDVAKHEDKRDQAITYVMRVVSNYATVGQDAQSASIKKINRLVTKNASEMLMTDGIEIYCKPNDLVLSVKQLKKFINKELIKENTFYDKYQDAPLLGLALRNAYISNFPCK